MSKETQRPQTMLQHAGGKVAEFFGWETDFTLNQETLENAADFLTNPGRQKDLKDFQRWYLVAHATSKVLGVAADACGVVLSRGYQEPDSIYGKFLVPAFFGTVGLGIASYAPVNVLNRMSKIVIDDIEKELLDTPGFLSTEIGKNWPIHSSEIKSVAGAEFSLMWRPADLLARMGIQTANILSMDSRMLIPSLASLGFVGLQVFQSAKIFTRYQNAFLDLQTRLTELSERKGDISDTDRKKRWISITKLTAITGAINGISKFVAGFGPLYAITALKEYGLGIASGAASLAVAVQEFSRSMEGVASGAISNTFQIATARRGLSTLNQAIEQAKASHDLMLDNDTYQKAKLANETPPFNLMSQKNKRIKETLLIFNDFNVRDRNDKKVFTTNQESVISISDGNEIKTTVILAPSGSGKTTLLQAMAGRHKKQVGRFSIITTNEGKQQVVDPLNLNNIQERDRAVWIDDRKSMPHSLNKYFIDEMFHEKTLSVFMQTEMPQVSHISADLRKEFIDADWKQKTKLAKEHDVLGVIHEKMQAIALDYIRTTGFFSSHSDEEVVDILHRQMSELSEGQQCRISVARSGFNVLTHGNFPTISYEKPAIALFDEPFAPLDTQNSNSSAKTAAQEMADYLSLLNQNGVATIVVSNDNTKLLEQLMGNNLGIILSLNPQKNLEIIKEISPRNQLRKYKLENDLLIWKTFQEIMEPTRKVLTEKIHATINGSSSINEIEQTLEKCRHDIYFAHNGDEEDNVLDITWSLIYSAWTYEILHPLIEALHYNQPLLQSIESLRFVSLFESASQVIRQCVVEFKMEDAIPTNIIRLTSSTHALNWLKHQIETNELAKMSFVEKHTTIIENLVKELTGNDKLPHLLLTACSNYEKKSVKIDEIVQAYLPLMSACSDAIKESLNEKLIVQNAISTIIHKNMEIIYQFSNSLMDSTSYTESTIEFNRNLFWFATSTEIGNLIHAFRLNQPASQNFLPIIMQIGYGIESVLKLKSEHKTDFSNLANAPLIWINYFEVARQWLMLVNAIKPDEKNQAYAEIIETKTAIENKLKAISA